MLSNQNYALWFKFSVLKYHFYQSIYIEVGQFRIDQR